MDLRKVKPIVLTRYDFFLFKLSLEKSQKYKLKMKSFLFIYWILFKESIELRNKIRKI